ncbi:MAG: hypothetical protein IV105_12330 [Rhizobacter sp.]|nr:hypothetical protein [Rhizobacter sp.]
MLNTTLKSGLAAVAAAAVLCAPVHATAALASVDMSGDATTPDYLAQAMRHALATTPLAAPTLADQATWFALPAVAMRSPQSVKLRASSDLALWHLVATVHAQQQNKAFDLVDAGTKTVWKLEHDNVSAVPLPGVLWLFVMGLLGIAGTRLKGKAEAGRVRTAAQPFGMAPAAA